MGLPPVDLRGRTGLPSSQTSDSVSPTMCRPTCSRELSQRTPGFFGWQQERWLYHCSDAAAFVGRIGWEDVKRLPDAQASLLAELAELGVEPSEAQRQLQLLHPDGDLTGYLFRCLHCGAQLAYSDAS